MITPTVSEEVSQHIFPAKSRFQALKTLKDLYDSHSEMDIIQLMLKLFSLEVNNNDSMLVSYKIRAIMHKIQASSLETLPSTCIICKVTLSNSLQLP